MRIKIPRRSYEQPGRVWMIDLEDLSGLEGPAEGQRIRIIITLVAPSRAAALEAADREIYLRLKTHLSKPHRTGPDGRVSYDCGLYGVTIYPVQMEGT